MANKRKRSQAKKRDVKQGTEAAVDHLSRLSAELICKIMNLLPLREVLCLSFLSHKLQSAAFLHLGLRKVVQFTDRRLYGYLPSSLTDEQFMTLMAKCPKVEHIYGLNPRRIERRRLRRTTRCRLSIQGVIVALETCRQLKGVETSHLKLMEAILKYLPHMAIIGHFRNHNGRFPVPAGNRLELPAQALLTSLHLTGIEVPVVPAIPTLRYLYLQWVRFTKSQPFRDFSAPELETFCMRHCIGPGNPLRFVPLAFSLASAIGLKRLELVGMTFLGRLLQRVTEDNYRQGSFRQLEKFVFGACRNVVETDIGYLMLTSGQHLKDVSLQPSLSRDSLFLALKMAEVSFSKLQTLQIGYVDDFPRKGLWSRADLQAFGLDEVVELPASVTDIGMKMAGMLFPNLQKLSIYNCPHLVKPTMWYRTPEDRTSWSSLTELSLAHCHCLRMEDFLLFLAYLSSIKCLILEDMFREPPKGCSYVGLSAGTGLGMSSAIVSNQQELIAVNGNVIEAMEAVPPAAEQREDRVDAHPEDVKATVDAPGQDKSVMCDKCGLLRSGLNLGNPGEPQPGTSRTCLCLDNQDTAKQPKKAKGRQPRIKKIISRDVKCMALSDEIRQDVKWAAAAEQNRTKDGSIAVQDPNRRIINGSPNRFISGGRGRRKRQPSTSSLLDKAVGTSDPILEDDSEVILKVMSDTLSSLIIISCGISDICLRHCPKMEHLEAEACRILRSIRLRRCPLLAKIAISQCPKVDAVNIARDLGRLPAKRNRLLFVQPFIGSDTAGEAGMLPAQFPLFDLASIEKTALQSVSGSYNVCVVWDSSSTFDFRLVHRQAIFSWMQLVTKINSKLVNEYEFSKVYGSTSNRAVNYPWGRRLYRLQGDFLDGNYTVLTDIPWIQDLQAFQGNHDNRNYCKWQGTIGLYRPGRCGHTDCQVCIDALEDAICEEKELGTKLRPYTVSIYLHDPEKSNHEVY